MVSDAFRILVKLLINSGKTSEMRLTLAHLHLLGEEDRARLFQVSSQEMMHQCSALQTNVEGLTDIQTSDTKLLILQSDLIVVRRKPSNCT